MPVQRKNWWRDYGLDQPASAVMGLVALAVPRREQFIAIPPSDVDVTRR